jgi:hypothetical protein
VEVGGASEDLVLKPLSGSTTALQWKRVSADRRTFSLRAGETLIGGLRFESSVGSLATADVSGQRWTFKRVGFLSPRLTVRKSGAKVDAAVLTPDWSGGGVVRFAKGPTYGLRRTALWKGELTWTTEGGFAVARQRPKGEGAEVELVAGARGSPELPLLLVLGVYLQVLSADDAAATSAASVVVSS